MLVLADVAEVGTAEIPERFTPSLAVLARETGLAKSTVADHLAKLEESDWIVRDRPNEAGMARGERTRYRLTFPGCSEQVVLPGDGAVQDTDDPRPGHGQPLSASRTTPVREADDPRPGGGQPYKEVRSSSDQPDLFGAPPSASPNGSAENAGTILASFIDYCESKGVNVRSLRGQYAKTIKEALDAGHGPTFVKVVLAQMLDDRVANRPSLLRNRLVEAQTGPEQRARASPNNVYRNPENLDDYDDWKKP